MRTNLEPSKHTQPPPLHGRAKVPTTTTITASSAGQTHAT